jgi:putative oxidoreductase
MYTAFFHSEAAAPTQTNLAAIILRMSLAVIFLLHGLDKIVYHDGGADWVNQLYGRRAETLRNMPEGQRLVTEIPTNLSFSGVQIAVAWGEFLGGLALALGMLTRLAALGEILIQLGAVILVTAPQGFQLRGGGFEYQLNLALIVMCLALMVLGPGHWSIDRTLSQRRAKRTPRATVSVPTPAPLPNLAPNVPAEHVAPGASS